MASDRARISRDPSRLWRSVVAQQGRVQLEADLNEAWEIEGDGRRDEAVDIIGPAGTPDDGYEVTPDGGRLKIGAGTMYLGGWRLTLDQAIHDDAQPDWLDAPVIAAGGRREVVLLRASEQEVGAVEDPALLDVALGGPDTSARTRLLQHILRLPLRGDTCAEAAAELGRALGQQGLSLDHRTLQLLSDARLKVDFVPPTPPPGPCDPPAEGGYLGADNQLIQVTVASFNPATGRGTLLWGYNNAAFLHRATSDGAGRLLLVGRPLDSEHEPRQNRPIEVLRRRVKLEDGSFVAAPEGEIRSVQGYDPDQRRITFAAALPGDYSGTAAEPLFVRLWQAEVPFQSGQPALLDPTGLTVTVDLAALPTLAGRPFWRFAVRPSTPLEVYPVRYKQTPQPPDGPRQWMCRLAVITEASDGIQVLEDCRIPFLPLTLQENDGSCCAVVLDPEQVRAGHGLQAIIDKLCARGPAKVSLRPGHYLLHDPLHLDARHDGLVLEACQDGAVIAVDGRSLSKFNPGLIVLDHADEVTLRGLRFTLPLVKTEDRYAFPKPTSGDDAEADAFVSIGVMAIGATRLKIEGCQFRYELPERGRLIALGVYGRGQSAGLALKDNAFLHDDSYQRDPSFFRVLIGYALSPETPGGDRLTHKALETDGPIGDAVIDDAAITGNRFAGLTVPVVVVARMGFIRCAVNRALDCVGGFYFVTPDIGATLGRLEFMRRDYGAVFGQTIDGLVNRWFLEMVSELGLLVPRPPAGKASLARHPGKVSITGEMISLITGEFRRIAETGHQAMLDQTRLRGEALLAQANQSPQAVLSLLKDDGPVAPAAASPPPPPAAGQTLEAGLRINQAAQDEARGAVQHHDYGRLYMVAVAARAAAIPAHPQLHVRENDLRILGRLDRDGAPESRNPLDWPFAGISVVLEFGEGDACVLAQDNRVRMATAEAPAAGVLFPEFATVTGNMLIQPVQGRQPNHGAAGAYCLTAAADFVDGIWPRLEVMGNLVHGDAFIDPPRLAHPDDSWGFVNELRGLQP